jgi:hypothetical protein
MLRAITTRSSGWLRTVALSLCVALSLAPAVSAKTGRWARAVAAFEHSGSDRTGLFSGADPFAASAGAPDAELAADIPGIWSTAIDAKGRVFVQGGVLGDLASAKPSVSRLDLDTHKVLSQTPLPMVDSEQVWNYPGGLGIHRNGFVYVAYAARMAKLDPGSGKVLAMLDLPTPNGLAHTSYNGFVLLSNGMIVTKSHHRKPDCPVQGYRAFIVCGVDGLPPSALVMIDLKTLQIVWTGEAEELIGGRITATRFGKQELIYLAGLDKFYRMRRD